MLSGSVFELGHSDEALLGELIQVYEAKRKRNALRSVYYDGKQALQDFGVSIPPAIRSQAETTLEWVKTGVHALTDRSVFEGFVAPDEGDDPFGLAELLDANSFGAEFDQAKVSSAQHACSFLTVSHGDAASGEPDVLILPRAADESAALWDYRRRGLRGFLSVVSRDETGMPDGLIFYSPEHVTTVERRDGRLVVADRRRNPLGRVTVAPLTLRPELKRPFGHSRITRAAMYYTDAAMRTLLRAEGQAEIYNAPETWVLGADQAAFGTDRWKAVMGRLKVISRDEDGEVPEVHRFNGASPQPHIDQLRMWASLFAGDQGLALSSLGIVQDNPSSAEAIYAAKEDLIIDTQKANESWGRGAVLAARLALELRDGVEPGQAFRLSAQFTDPARVSPTAAADAFAKRASVIPGFAESEVGLESAGLTREQIIRFQSERRRLGVSDLVARISERADAGRSVEGVVDALAERGQD